MIMTLEGAGVGPGGCGHGLVNPRNPTADRVRRGAWGPHGWPRCACRTRGKGGSGASPWHPGERKPYGWQSPVPAHGPARGGACRVRSSAARRREGGIDRTVRKLGENGPSGNQERSPEGGAVRGAGHGVRPQDCACGWQEGDRGTPRRGVPRRRPRRSRSPWPFPTSGPATSTVPPSATPRPTRHETRVPPKVCRPPIRHPGRRTAHQLLSALTRTP